MIFFRSDFPTLKNISSAYYISFLKNFNKKRFEGGKYGNRAFWSSSQTQNHQTRIKVNSRFFDVLLLIKMVKPSIDTNLCPFITRI